jgi:uncharacterized membrane protein (DUF373 family)
MLPIRSWQMDSRVPSVNHRCVRPRNPGERRRDVPWVAAVLGYSEFFLNTAVALAVSIGGVILFAVVMYDFVRRLGHGPFVGHVLSLLSGLLLVFIFTELISTVRVVITTRKVTVAPFLIVGMVAGIRRLIVIGAQAEGLFGTARFRDVMLEIGVLTGMVLVLAVALFLLRSTPGGQKESIPDRADDHGGGQQ